MGWRVREKGREGMEWDKGGRGPYNLREPEAILYTVAFTTIVHVFAVICSWVC